MGKKYSTYRENENVCKDLGRKLEAREYLDILLVMCRTTLTPAQCVQQAADNKQE
jgi:hypoxanthine phosphoribosyltransferase